MARDKCRHVEGVATRQGQRPLQEDVEAAPLVKVVLRHLLMAGVDARDDGDSRVEQL